MSMQGKNRKHSHSGSRGGRKPTIVKRRRVAKLDIREEDDISNAFKLSGMIVRSTNHQQQHNTTTEQHNTKIQINV